MASRSFIRKTRSQTRAAARVEGNANLKTDQHEKNSAGSWEGSFDAEVIDERADKNDCGLCNRPNNAERYMIECKDCLGLYHFSCAGVKKETVDSQSFSCGRCVRRCSGRASTIGSGRSTTSSQIAIRLALARDLQRLEEEKALEMQFLARKYELLEKADASEAASVHSSRSSQASRVHGWVREQNSATEGGGASTEVKKPEKQVVTPGMKVQELIAADGSIVIVHSTIVPDNKGSSEVQKRDDDELPDAEDTDGMLGGVDLVIRAQPTSTPITKGTTTSSLKDVISPENTEGAIGGVDSGTLMKEKQLISPVNLGHLWKVLEEVSNDTPEVNTGAIPKTKQAPYDVWRKETLASRQSAVIQQQSTEEHRELELQREKEQILRDLLRECDEKMKVQKQREAELRRQMQVRENQEAEFRKKKVQELKERDAELEKKNAELAERYAKLAKQDAELQRLQQMRKEFDKFKLQEIANTNKANVRSSVSKQSNNGEVQGNNLKRVPQPTAFQLESDQGDQLFIPSPVGVRSSYSSISSLSTAYVPEPICTCHNPYLDAPPNTYPQVRAVPPQGPPPNLLPLAANGVPSGISFQDGPTQLQVAARHVVPKKLPTFDGKAEDWPSFYSSYLNSTKICGFTTAENMLRLQDALRGDAKRQVSSLLLDPQTVDDAIWALQIRFGKPEQIVGKLIDQVLNVPSPKPSQPDQMVSFGLMVKNLCGHLRAMGMENHLSNPTLLRDLVLKLPEAVKLNWAMHREQLPVVNLSTFGDYMARIAYAMSNLPTSPGPESRSSRPDRKGMGFLHVHDVVGETGESDGEESSSSTAKVDSQCLTCGGGKHQVASCPTFKKLDFVGRWKEVRDKTLCGRCLTQHSRYPCKGRVCGIDGCQKRHHQLLHNVTARDEDKGENSLQSRAE